MKITDVTDRVNHGLNDDELLPIYQCVCGEKLAGWGDFVISVYKEDANECPKCGSKLFLTMKISVYQVNSEEGEK